MIEQTDGITIVGHIHRVAKDADGEVTMTLKIPAEYKHYAINLPEQTTFAITFRENEN